MKKNIEEFKKDMEELSKSETVTKARWVWFFNSKTRLKARLVIQALKLGSHKLIYWLGSFFETRYVELFSTE